MGFVKVAVISDVPEECALGLELDGKRVCLIRAHGEVYALANNCTHRDFPLSEGEIDADECTITCEWHGAEFDLRSGEATALPATQPVKVYECRVEGDDIFIDLGD